MAPLSAEEENYVRMSLLLTGISPRAVRVLFNSEFHPSCLDSTLKKAYTKLLDLKRKNVINEAQWNLLFTRFPDRPDSKTFDVTLMITLLRNLATITPPVCGFDQLPTTTETKPGADLARIKYYRNYMAHLGDGKLDTTFFNTAWDDITGAINRLGGQQMKQECEHMKTKTLDQTNQEIMLEIKCSNEEIREMKNSFESLQLSHTKMKKSHELLQENHTNVTKELQKIKSSQTDTVPWNVRECTSISSMFSFECLQETLH
ncbi:E3 ubiquitin-protein ligase DZIP3-like [Mytilus galloprovincialis]|uniref:E3 ubiquitin-protein ligase DZIP3-like n=1 Tax=Mytilus galloprovincialis TaxID=29158 RepID=UPI003F7C6B72